MRNTLLSAITPCIGLAMILQSVCAGAPQPYSGGSGTEQNPYEISRVADWLELMDTPEDWDRHFLLTDNLDFEQVGLAPVGTAATPFSGVFDGGGHVLSGILIHQPNSDYIGLFGFAKNAVIQNLGVVDVSIEGHTFVGGLVGRMGSNVGDNAGSITACYVTGLVAGQYMVGGLIGENYDPITDSYTAAEVTGASMWIGGLVGGNLADIQNSYAAGDVNGSADAWNVGGLVGEHYDGLIENAYAQGAVTGNAYVGGLIGVGAGTMVRCYASGSVTGAGGDYDYILGGLSGRNYGTITACYATGPVTGDDILGGLTGQNFGHIAESFASGSVGITGIYQWNWAAGGLVGQNRWSGEIKNAYATGTVISVEGVGGLVGDNSGTIRNAYSIGIVIGDYSTGGLVGGYDNTGVSASFWDIDTSGQLTSKGGMGLETAQMQQVSVYSMHGWGGQIWTMVEGQYPRLAWEQAAGDFIPEPDIPLEGQGTAEAPWRIADESDLLLITQGPYFLDKHYRLTAHLDMDGIPLTSIGGLETGAFSGVFDGGGHTVRNVTIQMPDADYVGMFGFVADTGRVKNLRLENVNVVGASHVGGLCGQNMGALINCSVTGTVTGTDYVGGLVGTHGGESWFPVAPATAGDDYDEGIAIVARCHAAADVSGDYAVGGLCGWNWSTIRDSHTAGQVSGSSYAGGLVGDNTSYGTIIDCSAAGPVEGAWCVGGLVGQNVGTVSFSHALGDVSGDSSVGGLAGENYFGTIRHSFAEGNALGGNYVGGLCGYNSGSGSWYGRIIGSFSRGDAVGDNYVGGLCGYNRNGTIRDSYAAGAATGDEHVGGLIGHNFRSQVVFCYSFGKPTGDSHVGGLVGSRDTGGNYGDTGNFWDQQASQTAVSVMGTGVESSHQMKIRETFIAAGWDFLGEADNGDEDIWRMCVDGADYPRLRWEFSRRGDLVCPDGVDAQDLLYLVAQWLGEGCDWWSYYCNWADISPDGRVNLKDFQTLASGWMEQQ